MKLYGNNETKQVVVTVGENIREENGKEAEWKETPVTRKKRKVFN